MVTKLSEAWQLGLWYCIGCDRWNHAVSETQTTETVERRKSMSEVAYFLPKASISLIRREAAKGAILFIVGAKFAKAAIAFWIRSTSFELLRFWEAKDSNSSMKRLPAKYYQLQSLNLRFIHQSLNEEKQGFIKWYVAETVLNIGKIIQTKWQNNSNKMRVLRAS